MNSTLPIVATVVAYLIGSLSFAVIVSAVMGLNDPRTYGSGNPGATNVLRSGSKAAAALTLLLDAVKGLVPVLLVKYVGPDYGLHDGTLALVAIGAFLGHLFPVFFKFKGGKGVATALGVLLGISGWLGLLVLLTWLAVALTTRYSSLSALVAAVLAPVYYVLLGGSLWNYDQSVLLAVIAMSALLLWRHAENIGRLLRGQESKIGSKKDKTAAAAKPVSQKKRRRR
ncbi:glycerol-3-phosphate 1-O-acyltransferase PlsY [Comamonas jiangduensis]|uniref:glycerol-3-phosphate 1-O-acyltransferase PlsY n=1 Tax=Comamonas jiangduensis TaxID=1194168 RepID=UPI003BF80C00